MSLGAGRHASSRPRAVAGGLLLACSVFAGCQRPETLGNGTFDAIWFAADGRTALTAGGAAPDGRLRRWDVATGTMVRALPRVDAPSRDGTWTVARDLSFLVAGATIWELDDGRVRATLATDHEVLMTLAMSPDDATVYVLTADSIMAFRTADGARTAAVARPISGPASFFGPIALAPDASTMAFFTGTRMGSDARVWLARLPALALEVMPWQPAPADERGGAWTQGMLFSPDSRLLAVSSGFQEVALYDVASQRVRRQLHCPLSVPLRHAVPVGFSRDGSRLVVHEDPEYPGLCIFEIPSGRLVHRIPEPADYNRRLIPTVGAERLVVRRHGLGPFEVYDLAAGSLQKTFCPLPLGCRTGTGPWNRIVGLAPDDRTLFVSQSASVAAIFDAATGERRTLLVDPELPRPWESSGARARQVLDRIWLAIRPIVSRLLHLIV